MGGGGHPSMGCFVIQCMLEVKILGIFYPAYLVTDTRAADEVIEWILRGRVECWKSMMNLRKRVGL